MTQKKFDIKDSENNDKNFSFEETLKLYENLKKFFTRTPCKKLKIIFEGPFNDYRTGIKDTVLECLGETNWSSFKASKIDKEKFIIKITFSNLIALEIVTNICGKISQSINEYEHNNIQFDKKQNCVTCTFVKK